MKKMETKEKAKTFAKEHKAMLSKVFFGACVAGYVGITVWEFKHLKTVSVKDWKKVTGDGPFDQLLDKPIVGAFATVEYEDGDIGIIQDVVAVAARLGEATTIE